MTLTFAHADQEDNLIGTLNCLALTLAVVLDP